MADINKIMMACFLIVAWALPYGNGLWAQDKPQFAFPVACTLNEDCWVINYVDVDPAPDRHRDFTCGRKTYEGHKGTDVALRSRVEMAAGVDVLAARAGKILRLRDGQDDAPKTDAEYAAIRAKDRDCGNGVIIDHGQGLFTQYCHLKQNSIIVTRGEQVRAGQTIAQVGQSGYSEFPHLHLSVTWEGAHIDPFTGLSMAQGCDGFSENLWEDDLPYAPYSVFDGGFAGAVPDFEAIKAGQPTVEVLQGGEAEALTYWAGFYHAEAGDKITLTITDPKGQIFARRVHTLDRPRKRPSYFYTGRRLNERALTPGRYVGTIRYEKEGHAPQVFEHAVRVE